MATCWTAFMDWLRLSIELGIGDSNSPNVSTLWGTARWGAGTSKWSGLEPSWLDVTARGLDVSITRGRARYTDRVGASGAVVRADNADGWLTWNSDALGAIDARPGRQLRLRAQTLADGVFHDLWRGYVETIDDQYQPWERPQAALVCQDAMAQVGHVDLPERPPEGGSERTDERIGRILTAADWPMPWRDLARGQVTCQATTMARNLADEAGVTADSEGGVVYAHTNGFVRFQNRDWLRTAPYAITVQAILGPGGAVCGSEHRVVRDGADVRNDVQMARAGGTAQRETNEDSISRYRRRTYQRMDLICETDAQVQLLVHRMITTRSIGSVRLTDVTVPVVDAASAAFVTSVDYGWRLRVVWEAEDGSESWSRDVHVMGLNHRIRPDGWELVLTVDDASASPAQPWGTGLWGNAHWTEAA